MTAILIKNGRMVDPANKIDKIGDIFIKNGKIAEIPAVFSEKMTIIDATDRIIAPGFIDLHVHLREPGREAAETIETGTKSAAAGGFTTVVAMPNTTPPMDTPETIQWVLDAKNRKHHIRVLASACLSTQREGLACADLRALAESGAVAFTDDGSTMQSRHVMEKAMHLAAELHIPIMDHAEDPLAEHNGVMHEGAYTQQAGLPGIPSKVEISMVQRDIELARKTGAHVHIQHVSTKEAIALIQAARAEGLPISGEATPHHLALCDRDVVATDCNFKMNPPLRALEDREAIRTAVANNILTAFATDHAPHTTEAKQTGFLKGPFGIIGLETAAGVTYTTMVETGIMNVSSWVAHWTTGPAAILGRQGPSLSVGQSADIVVLDVTTSWMVDPMQSASKSCNTPFSGMTLKGRAVYTISAGTIVYPFTKC